MSVGWITSAALVAQVEGQEVGLRPLQAGGHHHRAVAHGKVHQRAAREVQQWLGKRLALGFGQAVKAVLVHRRVDVLREVGLELGCGHRDAVEEQHQVDDVVVVGGRVHVAVHW